MKLLIVLVAFVAAANASALIRQLASEDSQAAAASEYAGANPLDFEFMREVIRNHRPYKPAAFAADSVSATDNIAQLRNQIQQIINDGHQLVNELHSAIDNIISRRQVVAVPHNVVSDGAAIIAELGHLSSQLISLLGNLLHQVAQPNSLVSEGAAIIAEEGAASAKIIQQLGQIVQQLASQPRNLVSDGAAIIAEGADAAAPYIRKIDQALGAGASEMGNIIGHLV